MTAAPARTRRARRMPGRPRHRMALANVCLALLALTAGCTADGGEDGADGDLPLALIYDGPQGCDDCAPTIAALLEDAPQPYRTQFVGPGTGTPLTADVLDEASLYVQPGGGQDLEAVEDDMADSADALRAWIHDGGSYIGLCFGGYLAGSDPGFDLLPVEVQGYTDTEGATVSDEDDVSIEVSYRGQPRHMYFQDGPAFDVDDDPDVEVLATYTNGQAAVLVAPYGDGKVGVSGPHPEADQSWYDAAGIDNPDGIDPDIAYDLIQTTTRR